MMDLLLEGYEAVCVSSAGNVELDRVGALGDIGVEDCLPERADAAVEGVDGSAIRSINRSRRALCRGRLPNPACQFAPPSFGSRGQLGGFASPDGPPRHRAFRWRP